MLFSIFGYNANDIVWLQTFRRSTSVLFELKIEYHRGIRKYAYSRGGLLVQLAGRCMSSHAYPVPISYRYRPVVRTPTVVVREPSSRRDGSIKSVLRLFRYFFVPVAANKLRTSMQLPYETE